MILLHGGPGVPDEMTEVRETLSRKYQVITFDQRGTGKGDHRNCTYTMADYLQDINNLAGFFKLTAFHLFGHSWGGLYAQLYADENPGEDTEPFPVQPCLRMRSNHLENDRKGSFAI